MKIASSQVAISNDYQREESHGRRVSQLKSAGLGNIGDAAMVEINEQNLLQSRQESMTIEQGAPQKTEQGEGVGDELNGHYDKSLLLMKMILERMTGEKVDLFDAARLRDSVESIEAGNAEGLQVPVAGGQGGGEGNPNDLMLVETYRYEKESNALQFAGSVQLQDGTTRQFAMAVEFSQEYEELSLEVVKREQLKDPLIISFSTAPVKLSGEKHEFDIDADGEKDSIASLEQGFGFLALDKNGDGIVNDGSELFGALSGNGFADLAQYDDNKDGFIDENDAVFDQLRIWVKNADEDKQVGLKEKGIGAIALDNVDSPFTVREGDEKLGIIRKSGYYLDENGKAGLIQQLDFVV